MLYLKPVSDDSADTAHVQVALAESTVNRLERAILASGVAERQKFILTALEGDTSFAGWALRAAEHRLGRTVNRFDEAAEWLCNCLETELACSLVLESVSLEPDEIDCRLLAMVRKLADYKSQLSEFTHRLEHEKLDSLKELAYGASHEINNPLANIAARAQTLLVEERDSERQKKLSAIHRQAMRAHEMIADLMLFARPPKLALAPCNLTELVQQWGEQWNELADEHNARVEVECPSKPVEVAVDATQLSIAVRALIVNSLQATGEGGQINISLRQFEFDDRPTAEIVVRDNGPGFSDMVRRHIFDPFFSGREAGRGLGFGLSKCWRIVTEHGGQVIVQRLDGTEISILLPLKSSVSR